MTTLTRPAAAGERSSSGPGHGAFVISLDFELHWGVRDHEAPDGPYLANLLGAREAVPAMLSLFQEFGVRATWATVGLLFADGAPDAEAFLPDRRPAYEHRELYPYDEPTGPDETADPIHFAPSLIDLLVDAPEQEIGTHTFSHYYCLERGQDVTTFRADLESACAIAGRRGITLRSVVFPRNQVNPEYRQVLHDLGVTTYRGNQAGRAHRSENLDTRTTSAKVRRLADCYVGRSSDGLVRWSDVLEPDGLCNVAASRFLRPYDRRLARLEPLRLHRITSSLERAARDRAIYHLWWHPHNFGVDLDENLRSLRRVLESFAQLRERDGMQSMTMHEVAVAAGAPARA